MFLKQNEELLKLLDSLDLQEYYEVGHREEEIVNRISDFTLVFFEYVKSLKKRMRRGAATGLIFKGVHVNAGHLDIEEKH